MSETGYRLALEWKGVQLESWIPPKDQAGGGKWYDELQAFFRENGWKQE